MNYEHLEQSAEDSQEERTGDSLLNLTALAFDWQQAKEIHADLEQQAKDAKKAFNKISQELIPEAMMESGLSEIKLADGKKVSFKEDISCSIKDYNKLDEFLSARGEDGMMKITLDVGKVPKNILRMILQELSEKFEIQAVPKQFVHPATMAAYMRRLCGINGITEAEVSVAEIDPEMVSIFRFYKTTVK